MTAGSADPVSMDWRARAGALADLLSTANTAQEPVLPGARAEAQRELLALKLEAESSECNLPLYEQRVRRETLQRLEKLFASATSSQQSAKPKKFTFGRKQAETPTLPTTQAVKKEQAAAATGSDASLELSEPSHVLLSSHPHSSAASTVTTGEKHIQLDDIPSRSAGEAVSLTNLHSRVIDLRHPQDSPPKANVAAVYLEKISNCLVLAPVVTGSVLLHDVKDSVLLLGCHQLRMHRSSNVKMMVKTESTPIVEQCEAFSVSGWDGQSLRVQSFDAPTAASSLASEELSQQARDILSSLLVDLPMAKMSTDQAIHILQQCGVQP